MDKDSNSAINKMEWNRLEIGDIDDNAIAQQSKGSISKLTSLELFYCQHMYFHNLYMYLIKKPRAV